MVNKNTAKTAGGRLPAVTTAGHGRERLPERASFQLAEISKNLSESQFRPENESSSQGSGIPRKRKTIIAFLKPVIV